MTLISIFLFLTSFAQADIQNCPLVKVATNNTFVLPESLCNERNQQQLSRTLPYLDQDVIQKFINWMDGFSSSRRIKVVVQDDLSYNGLFLHDTPDTIYVKTSIFSSPEATYVLFHELQHLFNYSYKNQDEEDWLNEGLSEAVEYLFSDAFPIRAFEQIQMQGMTPQLVNFDISHVGPFAESYTNSGLFVLYLVRHFGGMDLLRKIISNHRIGVEAIEQALLEAKQQGLHQVDDRYLNFDSLYLNYSFALALNTPNYSKDHLFGFNGSGLFSQMSRLKIEGKPFIFEIAKPDLVETSVDLKPYQTTYYNVSSSFACLELPTDLHLKAFKIEQGEAFKITPIESQIRSEGKAFKLIIVNLDGSREVAIKPCN